ncbi:MAG: hypothetical protein U1F87_16040 [Kiritimatiellia bacterium]
MTPSAMMRKPGSRRFNSSSSWSTSPLSSASSFSLRRSLPQNSSPRAPARVGHEQRAIAGQAGQFREVELQHAGLVQDVDQPQLLHLPVFVRAAAREIKASPADGPAFAAQDVPGRGRR